MQPCVNSTCVCGPGTALCNVCAAAAAADAACAHIWRRGRGCAYELGERKGERKKERRGNGIIRNKDNRKQNVQLVLAAMSAPTLWTTEEQKLKWSFLWTLNAAASV